MKNWDIMSPSLTHLKSPGQPYFHHSEKTKVPHGLLDTQTPAPSAFFFFLMIYDIWHNFRDLPWKNQHFIYLNSVHSSRPGWSPSYGLSWSRQWSFFTLFQSPWHLFIVLFGISCQLLRTYLKKSTNVIK